MIRSTPATYPDYSVYCPACGHDFDDHHPDSGCQGCVRADDDPSSADCMFRPSDVACAEMSAERRFWEPFLRRARR